MFKNYAYTLRSWLRSWYFASENLVQNIRVFLLRKYIESCIVISPIPVQHM